MICKIKECENDTTRTGLIICDDCSKTITTKEFIILASDYKSTNKVLLRQNRS